MTPDTLSDEGTLEPVPLTAGFVMIQAPAELTTRMSAGK